jgi:hypothetical protein
MTKPQQTTATASTPTETLAGAQRVEQIDPATLLVDVNVRAETVADKEFVASITDLGVLQPIRARPHHRRPTAGGVRAPPHPGGDRGRSRDGAGDRGCR